MHCPHVVLHDVDLVQRRDHHQLQLQRPEQLHGVGGVVRVHLAEGLVDDHEAEGPDAGALVAHAELEGDGRGQDGVGQLGLLAAGEALRVLVVLLLLAVGQVAFDRGELQPVAHVQDPAPPVVVRLERLDEPLDPAEGVLHLRLVLAGDLAGVGDRGPQGGAEVPDGHVRRRPGLQLDEGGRVAAVADLGQAGVDLRHPGLDLGQRVVQALVERDQVLQHAVVQVLFEPAAEAGQVLLADAVVQPGELLQPGGLRPQVDHLRRPARVATGDLRRRLAVALHGLFQLPLGVGLPASGGLLLLLQPLQGAHPLLLDLPRPGQGEGPGHPLEQPRHVAVEVHVRVGLQHLLPDGQLAAVGVEPLLQRLELAVQTIPVRFSAPTLLFHLALLILQRTQPLRAPHQLAALLLQPAELLGAGPPVQPLVLGLLEDAPGRLLPRPLRIAFSAEARELRPVGGQPAVHLARLPAQGPQLLEVVPAQHPALAAGRPGPVVLLVAGLVLDQPRAGQAPGEAGEDLQVVGADVVEVGLEVLLQPLPQRGVGLDLQLGGHASGIEDAHPQAAEVRRHPEVHQPAAQVGVPHESVDPAVVLLRHQHAQGEVVQQPLDGRLPLGLLRPHPQELAGEGQLGLGQLQRLGHPGAQLQVQPGDVGAPALQGLDLAAQLGQLLPGEIAAPAHGKDRLLELPDSRARLLPRRGGLLPVPAEILLRAGLAQADGCGEADVALQGIPALGPQLLLPLCGQVELLQPYGRAVGVAGLQDGVAFGLQPLELPLHGLQRGAGLLEPPLTPLHRLQQAAAGLPGEHAGQRLVQPAQPLQGGGEITEAPAVLQHRLQQLELVAGLLDLQVAGQQVLEVLLQLVELRLEVPLLEHLGTDELVEVAQDLDPHRLGEQGERLLGAEAEQAREVLGVQVERVEKLAAVAVLQALLPLARLVHRQQVRDGRLAVEHEVAALQVVPGEPAHLSQGDGAEPVGADAGGPRSAGPIPAGTPQPGVDEHAQQDRVGAPVAQLLGAGVEALLLADGAERAVEVGALRALPLEVPA